MVRCLSGHWVGYDGGVAQKPLLSTRGLCMSAAKTGETFSESRPAAKIVVAKRLEQRAKGEPTGSFKGELADGSLLPPQPIFGNG